MPILQMVNQSRHVGSLVLSADRNEPLRGLARIFEGDVV